MNKPAPNESAPRWFWSLRKQITLWLGALLLIAIAVHFTFVHPALHRRIVAMEREKIQIYADSVAFQISGDFEAAIKELNAMAAIPLVRNLDFAAVGPMFTRLETISPSYIEFTLLDKSGRVILRPSKPERVGEDRSMREYFRVARDERRTYLSEVFTSTAGNRSLILGTPVFDKSQTNVIAVLTGSMALMDRNPEMYKAVLEPSVPNQWCVSLWSHDHQLLAHSENGNTNLLRYTEGGTMLKDEKGERWHVAAAHINNANWTVLVQMPDALVLTQVARVTRPMTGAVIGLLLGLATLGFAAARRFVRPLETLTTALNQFGHDGRPKVIAPAGSGEIAGSIQAFNRMADERQQAESARRENLERFHIVARATNDAIWDWNLENNVIWWNEHFESLFGYKADEIKPEFEFWVARLHPEDKERVVAKINAIIEGRGQAWSDEYRFQRKDGAYVEILDRGYVLRDEKGRGVRMIGAMQDMTERKRAEQALLESQQTIQFTVEAAHFGQWDLNLSTHQTKRSLQHDLIFGYEDPPTDWGFEKFLTHVVPEDREHVTEIFQKGLATRSEWEMECRIIRRDNALRWIWVHGNVLTDTAGEPVRMLGIVSDITERKQTEEARLASDARYRALFEYAPDGIIIADAETYYIDANTSACKMLGYTRDELIGLHATDIVIPEDAQHIEPSLKLINAGSDYHREWQFRRKDASVFAGEVIATVMPDGNLLAMIRDITERKRVQEMLAWRTRLALLRAEIAEAFSRVGNMKEISQRVSEALVTHLDAAVARIWILNDSENMLELVASAGLDTHLEGPHSRVKMGELKIGRIAQNHKPYLTNDFPHDTEISDPAWTKREEMTAFAGYPLLVEDRVIGVIAMFARASLSQERLQELGHVADGLAQWILRKRAEEALKTAQSQLRDYARELETRVAHRTADLKAMNEQLESFVYSIAHDLRAPLRAMIGYSQMLVEDHSAELKEDAKDLLNRIQASSEFMDKLVIDLLAYGRAASAEIELSPVDVRKPWDMAVAQCASQIQQTQAQVQTIGDLPTVRAHEATLCQCLSNLLSNALKFIEPGRRPQVRFWADDYGDTVRIWVADNGIGIPVKQTDRVFRVFERLQSSRYPGTGIGLSIVRKGIERMGGKVGVDSEPGKGSRFWIELLKAT